MPAEREEREAAAGDGAPRNACVELELAEAVALRGRGGVGLLVEEEDGTAEAGTAGGVVGFSLSPEPDLDRES